MSLAKNSSVLLGKHDDGREGLVLAKLALGGMVMVPFGTGVIASSGGLAHIIGTATASVQSAVTSNPDGSGGGINFTVPPGLGQGVMWTERLWGRRFGVRWRANNSSTLLPFCLICDGIAYEIRNVRYHQDSVLTTAADHQSLALMVDELPDDGPHTVSWLVWSDVTAAALTKAVFGYGWLAERRAGYKDPPRWGSLAVPALLATGATALSSSAVYRKIKLHNTDAAARTVTLKNGSTIIQVVSMAAGASGEIDFGGPITTTASYTLTPDAANVVTWTPVFAEVR